METAAVRGGSLPAAAASSSSSSSSSSQPVRREWRAISEHSYRNNANEEVEHSKLGQTDERTIYEEAVGSLEVDFSSVTINGGNDAVLRKQLLDVSRRREELQQMEIQLKAQTIVRSEIMDVQNNYEAQLKEHSNATAKLKERLQERDQRILELELKMEEKDRELHAVNNEAAWAKEDFLREQNEKLATFRRERDNAEAEKAQHLKQIHDLQEHIKEKESHFLALEEQHRVAQDAILYKDERLREAQAWIARLQEMGALQSSSLQTELQERTDQFHQYYLSFQRQFMEMERHHVQAIQQLQLELAEAREQNGVHSNSSQITSGSSMDSSLYEKSQANKNNSIDSVTLNGTSKFIPNGKLNGAASFVSLSSTSSEVEHAPGVPVVPSSMVGVGEMPSGKHVNHFIPPSQVKPLPPIFMHPPGVPQSLSSTNSFITPVLHQHWQNHQVVSHVTQSTVENEHQISKADHDSLESGVHYKYELPVDKREVHEDQVNTCNNLQLTSGAINKESFVEVQLVKSIEKNLYQMSQEAEQNLSTNSQFHVTYGFDCPQQNNELKVVESEERSYQTSEVPHDNLSTNSKFHGTLGFDAPKQKNEVKVHNETKSHSIIHQKEPAFNLSQQWSTATVSASSTQNNKVISSNIAKCNGNLITSEGSVSDPLTSSPLAAGKAIEPTLLDERSLLACIVRAIPAGSGHGIRISSTLPNRLGKMLAPLHWHDYKKKYGKLDDFVAHHPELFIIEGDFIHLREGAQEKISATTAVAKVAAAAAACAPYSSLLPSVAVTPVAQANRLKKPQLADSNSSITVQPTEISDLPSHGDPGDMNAQIPKLHSQQLNGFSFSTQQARSDVKILSKTSLIKDIPEIHGSSEMRPHRLPNPVTGNGVNLSRTLLPSSQSKVSSNGRHGSVGKRPVGGGFVSPR